LESSVEGRIRAVFPVHLTGQCADPEGIALVARERDLLIVEDAAHAIGTVYSCGSEVQQIGSCHHSDMTAFSFHPVKTIAMGEGGAVATSNPEYAERLGRFLNHGMTRNPGDFVHADLAFDPEGKPNPWYYEMPEPGFNYRASDIHCALVSSQLKKLNRFREQRRALVARYDENIRFLAPNVLPLKRVPNCEPAWHLYPVLIDFERIGKFRSTVMSELREAGIGTQVHYQPVHNQPYFRQRYGERTLPGAESYYRRTLSLPLFSTMENDDVDRVCEILGGISGTGNLSS